MPWQLVSHAAQLRVVAMAEPLPAGDVAMAATGASDSDSDDGISGFAVLKAAGLSIDGVGTLEPVAVLAGHSDRVWHVSWCKTKNMLATCGGDKSVRLWAPKPTPTAPATDGAAGAGAAGAGAGAGSPEAQQAWVCVETLDGVAMRTVRLCEWSPCGRYLATASFDGAVRVWEIRAGGESELLATLEGHENEVKCVAWSADGQFLASCGRDKSIWVWDATEVEEGGEYECVSVLHGHTQDVKFVAFHPQRSQLISTSYDDTIKSWEEADDDWINTDTLAGHGSTVWQASFEGNGERLATCSADLVVKVWKQFEGAAKDGSSRYKCVATLPKLHSRTIFR